MANKKKSETAETAPRAAIGRERRLALALRAVLDQGVHDSTDAGSAEADAAALLSELGYGELKSIQRRLMVLNDELKTATESGNGKEIARLGIEIDRATQGLPPGKVKDA